MHINYKDCEYLEKSIKLNDEVFHCKNAELIFDYFYFGLYLSHTDRCNESIEWIEKCQFCFSQLYGEESPQTLMAYQMIAWSNGKANHKDVALKYCLKVEKMLSKMENDKNIDCISWRTWLIFGEIFRFIEDFPKAYEYAKKSISIAQKYKEIPSFLMDSLTLFWINIIC